MTDPMKYFTGAALVRPTPPQPNPCFSVLLTSQSESVDRDTTTSDMGQMASARGGDEAAFVSLSYKGA